MSGEVFDRKTWEGIYCPFPGALLLNHQFIDLLAHGVEPVLLRLVEALGGGREVADIDDDVVDVGQVEVDEVGDLGLLGHDRGVGVDEERAGQRVLAGVDGFGGGIDAFDGEIAQRAGVLLEVGVAEVADGVFVAADALDEDVVILGELEVGGARGAVLRPCPCRRGITRPGP